MFGIGLIIIGIIVLLETFGVLTGNVAGIVWGVALIAIGIAMFVRRAHRRERRMRWMEEHRRVRV